MQEIKLNLIPTYSLSSILQRHDPFPQPPNPTYYALTHFVEIEIVLVFLRRFTGRGFKPLVQASL